MNDTPLKGMPKLSERARHILDLVDEATRDLEWMRAADARLEALDVDSWRKVQNLSHNLAARAAALKLSVLERGATELEQFAFNVLGGPGAQKSSSVYAAQVAMELLGIEIESLKKEYGA